MKLIGGPFDGSDLCVEASDKFHVMLTMYNPGDDNPSLHVYSWANMSTTSFTYDEEASAEAMKSQEKEQHV